MPRSTPVRQRGPSGRFLSSSTSAAPGKQARTFFALPPEIRCAVYKALFTRTRTDKCVLRRRTEARAREAPYIILSDNTIIRTSKTICAEALPIFYSTQTFHYSAALEGFHRQSPFLLEHTRWIKHLSIEVTVNYRTNMYLDSTVAAHVQAITKQFPKLASFTLHVIPAIETSARSFPNDLSHAQASGLFDYGAAAEALKTLRAKIQLLRIVMFGNWDDFHPFRSAIADEEKWVQGGKCWGGWPGLSLTRAQGAAMSVRQRRYTVVGYEDVIHPHKVCIRIFNLYQPWMKRRSTKKED